MRKFLVLIGILAILASAFFFYQAYDKYMNYYQSSLGYSSLDKNTYVGGDAYNYIINGNYFTGFSVLGIGGLLFGMLCFGIAHISSQGEDAEIELSKNTNEISRVRRMISDYISEQSVSTKAEL